MRVTTVLPSTISGLHSIAAILYMKLDNADTQSLSHLLGSRSLGFTLNCLCHSDSFSLRSLLKTVAP